jgi:hypothetical protein
LTGSPAPEALAQRFVGSKLKFKKARGFSLGELQQAGLPAFQARCVGIRVDRRRSTVHPQNVATLKAFLSPPTPAANVTEASKPGVERPAARGAPPIKKAKPRRKTPAKKRKR